MATKSNAYRGQSMVDLVRMIDKNAMYSITAEFGKPGIRVPVKIVDIKCVYGRHCVLIQPVNGGSGSMWVDADKVMVIEDGED